MWAGVAALTALAFALRLPGLWESVAGDELFTLAIAKEPTLTDALERARETAITPPLHYVLVWAAAQIGDPRVWIKVPSLLVGTATVPVVFMLGRRAVGAAGGLIAALLVAISPFAIFYSEEARVYATLILLVALSSLLLLTALERGRWMWWAAFSLVTCLILYAHYSGAFFVAAQALWALVTQVQHRRAILLAHLAAAIGYLPWIPGYLDQRVNAGVDYLATVAPLTVRSYLEAVAGVFPGRQGYGLRELPGLVPSVVVALSLAVALVLFVGGGARNRRAAAGSPVGLLVVVLLATPVGALLYSLLGDSILLSRNLSAAFPAAMVVIGGLLAAGPAEVAIAATVALVAAVSVGTAKGLGDEGRRTPWNLVAEQIDARAGPSDIVVAPHYFGGEHQSSTPLDRGLAIWLESPHRIVHSDAADAQAWARLSKGDRVFVVRPELGDFFRSTPRYLGPGLRFHLVSHERWEADTPIALNVYQRLPESSFTSARLQHRDGELVLANFLGRDRPITPGAVDGYIEEMSGNGRTVVSGWAADREAGRPAEWLLAFIGHRLVAVAAPTIPRPDLAEIAPDMLLSGYQVETGDRPVRVVAIRDGRGSLLQRLDH